MPLATKLLLFFWSPAAAIPLALVLSGVPMPQPLTYAWHKALHVLGVVLFLGNVVTQVAWLDGAFRSKNPAIVRACMKTLSTTDLLFMGPGTFLVVANGAILAQTWGGVERFSWMLASLVLFGAWGVVSIPLTVIQLKMLKVLGVTPDAKLLDALGARSKALGALTALMLAIPLVILILMVVKPRLW